MTHLTELPPAGHNEPRPQQLDANMQQDEFDILSTNRHEVSEFLRIGRKWGFFTLAEKTSAIAGREVLANAYMPESNLAALIAGMDPESLAAIEKEIDDGLVEDPKYAASFLISRIKDLHKRESNEHGTVALDAGDATELLAREGDQTQFLRCVNVPAPFHATPEWFKVIEKYGMGPEDMNMILERMDRANAKSTEEAVSQISTEEHDAVMSMGTAAA